MVLVLGDAHADDPDNRAALYSAYDAAGESVALQAGDLGHYDLPVPTWFVAGNDENLDVIDALRRGEDPGRPVRNAYLLASVETDAAGLTVAGLSGNYAPTKYDLPRNELAGDRRRHFVREDVERLMTLGEADDVDVLLTHEAPHGLVSFGYDPGSEPIDEVVAALEPALCLVGHFHRHAEATIGETHAVALAPVWESYSLLDPATLALERKETPKAEG